ncbi:hypothetical protein M3Y98_00184400 [Aphelenchoides besseyi]|nr:hypothetical protein M3Y98_00184400 [Aphelenchoides besseyi]KAI6200148.1 hypothetical protein M3Y96_00702300 [Aphelenchoides besseyi]KAI6200165.1 hypothetical protein M3Y96_00704000 [Aphelenchoides besseyi]
MTEGTSDDPNSSEMNKLVPKPTVILPEQALTLFFGKSTWCLLSERRLFAMLVHYKPVGESAFYFSRSSLGIRKHVHLMALAFAMHNIVEDEEDTDFEELLLPDDYKLYLERQRTVPEGGHPDVLIFPPCYRFRPTVEEIEEKLSQFYDFDMISQHDLTTQQIVDQVPVEFTFDYAK